MLVAVAGTAAGCPYRLLTCAAASRAALFLFFPWMHIKSSRLISSLAASSLNSCTLYVGYMRPGQSVDSGSKKQFGEGIYGELPRPSPLASNPHRPIAWRSQETPTSPDLSSASVLPLPVKPFQCVQAQPSSAELSLASVLPSPAKPFRGIHAPNRYHAVRRVKNSNMPMHWPLVLSTFALTRIVELVKDMVELNRGIKDKTLKEIAKSVLLFCGTKVSPTHVYNHLGKWRERWNMLKVLAKAEGAEWREESIYFYMDYDAFLKHVNTHPMDVCFINTPIENYAQMEIIFGKRGVPNPLATDTPQLAFNTSWIMQRSMTPILPRLKRRGRGGSSPTIATTSGGELMMLLFLFCSLYYAP